MNDKPVIHRRIRRDDSGTRVDDMPIARLEGYHIAALHRDDPCASENFATSPEDPVGQTIQIFERMKLCLTRKRNAGPLIP